jgi:hypothetical protein
MGQIIFSKTNCTRANDSQVETIRNLINKHFFTYFKL